MRRVVHTLSIIHSQEIRAIRSAKSRRTHKATLQRSKMPPTDCWLFEWLQTALSRPVKLPLDVN